MVTEELVCFLVVGVVKYMMLLLSSYSPRRLSHDYDVPVIRKLLLLVLVKGELTARLIIRNHESQPDNCSAVQYCVVCSVLQYRRFPALIF